jgi:hypothetical protein
MAGSGDELTEAADVGGSVGALHDAGVASAGDDDDAITDRSAQSREITVVDEGVLCRGRDARYVGA